jgi:hypothetical protein
MVEIRTRRAPPRQTPGWELKIDGLLAINFGGAQKYGFRELPPLNPAVPMM